jgi:hypothetical protein
VRSFASNPFGLSLSKPLFEFSSGCFYGFRCRSVAAAGDRLSFASPKESRQRKGDPGACVPSLRYRHLAVLSPAGVPLELAALRQSRALIRLGLRSSAHSQGFSTGGSGSESDAGSGLRRAVAIIFIAGYARSTRATALKHSINRHAAWFLGSDRNFAAKHPKGAPKARRIWALTSKTPESASESASDFYLPPPCGRAEQRRLGRIKILDVRRPRSGLVSKISGPDEQRKESRSDPDFGSPFLCLLSFGEAKESRSPAAATERHRNAATLNTLEATQVQL